MAEETTPTDLVVSSNPLALVGAMEIDDVIKGFNAVGEWRYSFRRKGQEIEGLSVDGVQDGVRQMSRLGEAIRTLWVHLEKETEREAFYTAMAARYAISPDGREICMDTTIRGKRISKYEQRADGKGEYFNEDWFSHGITKAARNAEEALMPEALKQWMIAAARQAGTAKTNGGTTRAQADRREAQHRTAPADGRMSQPARNDRQQVLDLLKRMQDEWDQPSFRAERGKLRALFPDAFTKAFAESGAVPKLSSLTDEQAAGVRLHLREALDSAPPPAGGQQQPLVDPDDLPVE